MLSFESIAYIVDTYIWFLLAALLIGLAVGWLAGGEPENKQSD